MMILPRRNSPLGGTVTAANSGPLASTSVFYLLGIIFMGVAAIKFKNGDNSHENPADAFLRN